MILRMKPKTVTFLGLLSLCLGSASLSRWFPGHSTQAVDRLDGLSGFLYGVAIALLLLGIWMQRHEGSRS